jgi:N-acetyltransferase 10
MQRKKLDSRIPALIANGVTTNHRSFLVLVGDRGKDAVVTLHYLLSKARVSARPSVLWCYKKELGFTRCVHAVCVLCPARHTCSP